VHHDGSEPLASTGKTPVLSVYDWLINGELAAIDAIEILGYLKHNGCSIDLQVGDQLVLNQVLRSREAPPPEKEEFAHWLITTTAAKADQIEPWSKANGGSGNAIEAAVSDPHSMELCLGMLLEESPGLKVMTRDGKSRSVAHLICEHLQDDTRGIRTAVRNTISVLLESDMPRYEPEFVYLDACVAATGSQALPGFLQWLIGAYPSVDATSKLPGNEMTPLHRAAETGDQNMATIVVEHGGDIRAKDSAGCQPLHLACIGQFPAMVQQLLRNKANPNAGSSGGTPLEIAIEGSLPGVCSALLTGPIDTMVGPLIDPPSLDPDTGLPYIQINLVDTTENQTPLDKLIALEAEAGSEHGLAICVKLIQYGARCVGENPIEPLLIRIADSDEMGLVQRQRTSHVICALLDSGLVNPNTPVEGSNPLDLLVWKPHSAIMESLLAAGGKLQVGILHRVLRGMASEQCTEEKYERLFESIAILTEGGRFCEDLVDDLSLIQLCLKLQLIDVIDILITNGASTDTGGPLFDVFKMYNRVPDDDEGKKGELIDVSVLITGSEGFSANQIGPEGGPFEGKTLLQYALSQEVGIEDFVEMLFENAIEPCDANLIPPMSPTGKADGSKAASSDRHEPVLVQVFLELLPLPPESPRANYLKWALLFLIGHGANVNVTIDGEEWEDDDVLLTPLKLALRLCDMEIVNAIIQAGGNVNLGDPLVDLVLALTLMEEAPSNDNPFYVFLMKAIDVLVESGANVNVGEPSIFTRAWTSWKFGLAEELANKGAKVTSEDPVPNMLRVILEQGVSMTEKENAAGLKKLVLFCISRGADTGTHDEHSGKSGMRLALECLDKDIMKAMLRLRLNLSLKKVSFSSSSYPCAKQRRATMQPKSNSSSPNTKI